MQKKIIALAIAAAFSAPAFADTSNVTVYGLLNASVDSVKNTLPGAANAAAALTQATNVNRLTSNASRFGIKGSEDLGDGMSAIFQIESRVNVSGNETGGGAGVFSGMRNSNVGLKGNFGTAFLGHWDTPFKAAHNAVELFDNTTIASATALMGKLPGTTVNNAVDFTLRQNSSVQYWTPVMSGFQGKLAYSMANAGVAASTANVNANGTVLATAVTSGLTSTVKPTLTSLSVDYNVEQFYAAYAYEEHKEFRGASLKDTGHRVVGAYKFTDGQVGLAYDRLTVAKTTAVNASRAAWELSGKYKFGASNVGAFYTKAGLVGGVANTGANQVSLRYGYNFSKRTEAYALYTAIKNDTNAAYGISDVANGTVAGLGSKVSGLGFGLVHTF